MKTKMFWGNQYVGKFNCDGRKYTFSQKVDRWIKKWVVRLGVIAFLLGMITGSYKIGQVTTAPKIVSAQVIKEVPTMPEIPVLQRIIVCESNNKQFNANGQVLIHVNTNGTYDIGVGQVNSIWNATATKMGYDLTNESDNRAFTLWLFLNKGNQIWYSSEACWNK